MPNSIGLPAPYHELTAPSKDGGVLTERNHLRDAGHVPALCLTRAKGAAHALASRLNAPRFKTTDSEGGAHALASRLTEDSFLLIDANGVAHPRSSVLGRRHFNRPNGETHAHALVVTDDTIQEDAPAPAPRMSSDRHA
jgi:hypothetical protein